MKVAVSSTGSNLNSPVDERFGRARYFVLVDTDTGSLLEVFDNSTSMAAQSGAGVGSAQFVCDAGVDVVITGSIGPKAFYTLETAGIKIYTGATGSVAAAIDSFNAGKLEYANQGGPAGSRGRGMGLGGGRGQGGGGRGMGLGGGRGQGGGGRGRGLGGGRGMGSGNGRGQGGGDRKGGGR